MLDKLPYIQLCAYNELSTMRACAATHSGPEDRNVAGRGAWTHVCLDAHLGLLLRVPHHGRRMVVSGNIIVTTVVTLVSSSNMCNTLTDLRVTSNDSNILPLLP